MIIDFSIENYKSIRELQSINFLAGSVKSKNKELDKNNVIKIDDKTSLLKTVALYGGNGSGKSNLIKGLLAMLFITSEAMSNDKVLDTWIDPFYFDTSSDNKPTFFQIQFIVKGKMYRYGFQATTKEIVSEWLYGPAETSETFYFERQKGKALKINTKYFNEAKGLEKSLRNSNLFLNVVDALNGKIAMELKYYLSNSIKLSLGVDDYGFRERTLDMLPNEKANKLLLKFLNLADFGIEEIYEENDNEATGNDNIDKRSNTIKSKTKKEEYIVAHRPVYDGKGISKGTASYNFDLSESEGTKKLFNYAGAILRSLRVGCMMVIDELDARLHPILTKKIVEMYNSPVTNKKGAQLLFATHDTNLLSNELLRRDQIYFAEKDTKGVTEFYSLYDLKGVRNDASFEKDYIKGKYGAIPYLGDFNELFDE